MEDKGNKEQQARTLLPKEDDAPRPIIRFAIPTDENWYTQLLFDHARVAIEPNMAITRVPHSRWWAVQCLSLRMQVILMQQSGVLHCSRDISIPHFVLVGFSQQGRNGSTK